MNSKFFDLKKEKQDRMINAALKIFALHGYRRASTDDIVKEAGISKGLLFHYFENKIGVYNFIYDYSVRYISLELKSAVNPNEKNLIDQEKAKKKRKMKRRILPCLLAGFSLPFTLFLYGPFELFAYNRAEFAFSLGDFFWWSLALTVLCGIVLSLIPFFLKKKAYSVSLLWVAVWGAGWVCILLATKQSTKALRWESLPYY